MEKQSKKMVITIEEMATIYNQIAELQQRVQKVGDFQPNTDGGKAAQKRVFDDLQKKIDGLQTHTIELRTRLETETVAYLAGEDTDEHVPSPDEALRQAS